MKKTFLTLALSLTAVSSAWAQQEPNKCDLPAIQVARENSHGVHVLSRVDRSEVGADRLMYNITLTNSITNPTNQQVVVIQMLKSDCSVTGIIPGYDDGL